MRDAYQEQLDELSTFIDRNGIITRPEGEPVIVAPTPEFYRWSFASMWAPGPFEPARDGARRLEDAGAHVPGRL